MIDKKIKETKMKFVEGVTLPSNFKLSSFIFFTFFSLFGSWFFYYIGKIEGYTWTNWFVLFFGACFFIFSLYLFILFFTYYVFELIQGFKKYSKIYYTVLFLLGGFAILFGVYYFFEGWKGIVGLLGAFFISILVYVIGPKIKKKFSKS